jgi:hypothetical protein
VRNGERMIVSRVHESLEGLARHIKRQGFQPRVPPGGEVARPEHAASRARRTYLRKILQNAGVVRYLSQHHADVLGEFQKLVEAPDLKSQGSHPFSGDCKHLLPATCKRLAIPAQSKVQDPSHLPEHP